MKLNHHILTIGIGGVSRAGKTELSNFLKEKFEALGFSVAVIQQDNYVFSKKKIPKIQSRIDWESPDSIDHKAYRLAILNAQKDGNDVVIAEGLLNFVDHSMVHLFDKKIFMQIKRSTFEKRKAKDTRWGNEPDWYINHIWESYQKYGRTILNSNTNYLSVFGENRSTYQTVWEYVFPNKSLTKK